MRTWLGMSVCSLFLLASGHLARAELNAAPSGISLVVVSPLRGSPYVATDIEWDLGIDPFRLDLLLSSPKSNDDAVGSQPFAEATLGLSVNLIGDSRLKLGATAILDKDRGWGGGYLGYKLAGNATQGAVLGLDGKPSLPKGETKSFDVVAGLGGVFAVGTWRF